MREKIITGTRDDGEKTGPMAKARRWAGGHKTMLVCIGVGALTAFAAIASCRTGHAGGVKTGYLAGFPDGRTEGYAKGHDAGYADGLASAPSSSVFSPSRNNGSMSLWMFLTDV